MSLDVDNDQICNSDPESMYAYGNSLIFEGKNVSEGQKYIEKSIELGYVQAMFAYGHYLDYGEGVEIDKNEAMRYFKMAADKGVDEALDYYELIRKEVS